jgi:predicted HicB family RNase H-like nuclease
MPKLSPHDKDDGQLPRLAYRLLFSLDDALRTLMKRRGELSLYVTEALETADWASLPLLDIRAEKKAPEVNMRLPEELNRRVHEAKILRKTSLNVLVNSALAQWLARRNTRVAAASGSAAND